MGNKHIKMIDDVLDCLCNTGNDYNVCNISQIHNWLIGKGIDIGEVNIAFIVRKLHKEGYVELIEAGKEGEIESCIINFDGKMFKELGGYKQVKINLDAEKDRLDRIEKNQKVHRNWMTALTAILAGGTSIAAWYYLTELFEYYGWNLCFCH